MTKYQTYLVIWRPLRSNKVEDMKVIDQVESNEGLIGCRNQVEKDISDIYVKEHGVGKIEVVLSNPNSLYWIE